MKKFFVFALLSFAAFAVVSPSAKAQYSRRAVAPPVAETEELDPSTPLGKVQEIARRLETIEATTAEIGRALDAYKVPDYKSSIDKILEASGATRADVAQLGEIASSVRFVVDTMEASTAATSAIAKNVETTAEYLRYVPTGDVLNGSLASLEKTVIDAIASSRTEQTGELLAVVNERLAEERAAFAEYRTSAEAEAQAFKNKLEAASNIIILLGLGIIALFVVNVTKFVYDKAQQARQEERERRNAEIRELVATANKNGK